ncbi:NlpC/P60 family protein [Emcibacter sp.]|uniref:NlpC/P60 family protein n=1 Tax=Emcibacter sp. TaxID=1979954 RepID=UPI002AA72F8C|nr:NlpC/P60 family protein [Emcibacter sp.]
MVRISEPLRKRAILAARFCVGSLFRHQGRIPGKKAGEGLDCVGLVLYVGRQICFEMEDHATYRPVPGRGQLESAASKAGLVPLSAKDRQPGDVVLIRPRRLVQHTGILTDKGIVHADARLGCVVEQGIGQFPEEQITKAFRFPVTGD